FALLRSALRRVGSIGVEELRPELLEQGRVVENIRRDDLAVDRYDHADQGWVVAQTGGERLKIGREVLLRLLRLNFQNLPIRARVVLRLETAILGRDFVPDLALRAADAVSVRVDIRPSCGLPLRPLTRQSLAPGLPLLNLYRVCVGGVRSGRRGYLPG